MDISRNFILAELFGAKELLPHTPEGGKIEVIYMGLKFCPGQNTLFWKSDDIFDISCPDCHGAVEFFKDDIKRECPKCNKVVFNPRLDLGCAAWCPGAVDCIGPEKLKALKKSSQSKQSKG